MSKKSIEKEHNQHKYYKIYVYNKLLNISFYSLDVNLTNIFYYQCSKNNTHCETRVRDWRIYPT